MSGQRSRLHPGRRADHDIAPSISGISRPARKPASRTRRTTARRAASRSSLTGPRLGAASSASSPARRSRCGPGPSTRFIATNLDTRNARVLYEDVYCAGVARPKITSNPGRRIWRRTATSCTKATANQLRLFLHAGAYWLMWGLRVSMPKRSMWRVAQFDTLRLRLIKIAARVVEMKTMIRVHLPNVVSRPGYIAARARAYPALPVT